MMVNYYKWMSLQEVLVFEAEARALDVSIVARSPRGFLTAYKRAESKHWLSTDWINKRNGFIARHLIQYRQNPTRRRKLALIMWAYMP